MSTATPTPAKPPPPKPSAPSPASSNTGPKRSFTTARATALGGQKVVIYGPGGVGKTELCKSLETVNVFPLFVDVEAGAGFCGATRVDPIPQTFQEVRDVLHDTSIWKEFSAVVIDSLTKLEELVTQHVILNVKHEKGHKIGGIEDYGFGKGYVHTYEAFQLFLSDLDALQRQGKHIICVCHDCTANVPNPSGEDWIRYEPRLQASKAASIRHRVKEWCDHLLYVGYDVAVNNDGKGVGGGTRTIYPMEMPAHWAKSRKLSRTIPYGKGSPDLWNQLFSKE